MSHFTVLLTQQLLKSCYVIKQTSFFLFSEKCRPSKINLVFAAAIASSQLQTKILKIGAWIRLTVIITRRTDRTSKRNLCTEKIRLSMVSKYGNNLGSYITQREPGAALLVKDEKKAPIRAAALHNMYEM